MRTALLPSPEVYDDEIKQWPWRKLVERCTVEVAKRAPKNGVVLDYMSGTGTMLAAVRKKRPDLNLIGCDVSKAYVAFARSKSKSVEHVIGDARKWRPLVPVDMITFTAGLHHLSFRDQERFLDKVRRELKQGGLCIIGEEALTAPKRGQSRTESVVALYAELFPEILKGKISNDVMKASLDVMVNDLLCRGEFKRDLHSLLTAVRKRFTLIEIIRTWPTKDRGCGDYLIIARK